MLQDGLERLVAALRRPLWAAEDAKAACAVLGRLCRDGAAAADRIFRGGGVEAVLGVLEAASGGELEGGDGPGEAGGGDAVPVGGLDTEDSAMREEQTRRVRRADKCSSAAAESQRAALQRWCRGAVGLMVQDKILAKLCINRCLCQTRPPDLCRLYSENPCHVQGVHSTWYGQDFMRCDQEIMS